MMRGLIWISNAERKRQWKLARFHLRNAHNGAKLRRSNGLWRTRHQDAHGARLPLRHSFLRINNQLIAFDKGSLASGHFGQVKQVEQFNGQTSVIKIIELDASHSFLDETKILYDLSLIKGWCQQNGKCYIWQNYLGVDLNHHHFNSADQVLDTFIQVSNYLRQLHKGLCSRTKTAYFHNDIKPSNILIDATSKAHLIDYGLASSRSNPGFTGGTLAYMAPELKREYNFTAQTDIFALGKTMLHFLPRHSQARHLAQQMTASQPTNRPTLNTIIAGLLCCRYRQQNSILRQALSLRSYPPHQVDHAKAICALLNASTRQQLLIDQQTVDQIQHNQGLCIALVAAFHYLEAKRPGPFSQPGRRQAHQFIRNLMALHNKNQAAILHEMQRWYQGYGCWHSTSKPPKRLRAYHLIQSGLFYQPNKSFQADSYTKTRTKTAQKPMLAQAPKVYKPSAHLS